MEYLAIVNMWVPVTDKESLQDLWFQKTKQGPEQCVRLTFVYERQENRVQFILPSIGIKNLWNK